jgi:hypothetical protein
VGKSKDFGPIERAHGWRSKIQRGGAWPPCDAMCMAPALLLVKDDVARLAAEADMLLDRFDRARKPWRLVFRPPPQIYSSAIVTCMGRNRFAGSVETGTGRTGARRSWLPLYARAARSR